MWSISPLLSSVTLLVISRSPTVVNLFIVSSLRIRSPTVFSLTSLSFLLLFLFTIFHIGSSSLITIDSSLSPLLDSSLSPLPQAGQPLYFSPTSSFANRGTLTRPQQELHSSIVNAT